MEGHGRAGTVTLLDQGDPMPLTGWGQQPGPCSLPHLPATSPSPGISWVWGVYGPCWKMVSLSTTSLDSEAQLWGQCRVGVKWKEDSWSLHASLAPISGAGPRSMVGPREHGGAGSLPLWPGQKRSWAQLCPSLLHLDMAWTLSKSELLANFILLQLSKKPTLKST